MAVIYRWCDKPNIRRAEVRWPIVTISAVLVHRTSKLAFCCPTIKVQPLTVRSDSLAWIRDAFPHSDAQISRANAVYFFNHASGFWLRPAAQFECVDNFKDMDVLRCSYHDSTPTRQDVSLPSDGVLWRCWEHRARDELCKVGRQRSWRDGRRGMYGAADWDEALDTWGEVGAVVRTRGAL